MSSVQEVKRLEPPEPGKIVTCDQFSLRADLFYFLGYLDQNLVELTKREKAIPTPVVRKLNRLMTLFSPGEAPDAEGHWVTFLSRLARQMGFISFDDSADDRHDYSNTHYDRRLRRRVRVYREEDLALDQARYEQYLKCSDLEKERQITQALCEFLQNELYHVGPLEMGGEDLSYWDDLRFDTLGCAVGAGGYMDLPKVRQGLLSILGRLEPGVWYDFADFVQTIKKNHPHLILDHKRRDRYNRDNFYHAFTEAQTSGSRYSRGPSSQREINHRMPDAFERVEGRYLAYFLETLPLLMGYVALAKVPPKEVKAEFPFPEYGTLQGFCLTPKGKAVLAGDSSYPFHRELKLLPNYDIHLHMPDFSERILSTLERIAPLRREGLVYSGKLNREMFCQAILQGERLESYLAFFRELGSLPQNVEVELRSWAGHAEKVVIYPGGVYLESLADLERIRQEKGIAPYVVGEPPGGLILREGEKVLDLLIEKGYSPLGARGPRPGVRYLSEEEWLVPFSGRDPGLVHTLSKIAEKAGETAEGEVYRVDPRRMDSCGLAEETLLDFQRRYLPAPPRGPWKKLFPQLQEEKKEKKAKKGPATQPLKMTPCLKIECPDLETYEKLKAYLTRKGMKYTAADSLSIFAGSEVKGVIAQGDWD